jgi:hypothetical protein
LQNFKWLPPEKDRLTISDACGEELTRTEVNLKFSEPDAARARILHDTLLRLRATARPIVTISE